MRVAKELGSAVLPNNSASRVSLAEVVHNAHGCDAYLARSNDAIALETETLNMELQGQSLARSLYF